MDIQRLRNLTTGILHTEMDHIYKDAEELTGMEGIMTHMLPNVVMAMDSWLRDKIKSPRFWDDAYDTEHVGDYELVPMNIDEREAFTNRYKDLPGLIVLST